MKRLIFVAVAGIILGSFPVWAEMYRYKDVNGTIRFTDNRADVPKKSRAGDSTGNVSQSEALPDDPSQIDKLLKIKTALDEENAQFTKESLALSEERKTLSGSAAIKAYNEKVSALNARVDDYEKRRAAFQKDADAFEAALKKQLAPPQQSPQPSSP
jgi:hypothetical protein